LLVAAVLTAGCARDSTKAWEIVPGERLGLLDLSESEMDLQAGYGAPYIRHTSVYIGEGEHVPGTALFPDDPEKRVEIIWQDTTVRRYPARAILSGAKSQWKLSRGVTLGTTLSDLERINGRPFAMAGFGWDYAGVVTSWNGGALDSLFQGRAWLYLEPEPDRRQDPHYAEVQGDHDFASDSPAMRALEPKITRIQGALAEPRAASTPEPPPSGAPALDIHERDSGKIFTFPTATRFTIILDGRKYPADHIVTEPEGIVGRIAEAPSVEPPFYAVRFEAVRTGTTSIRVGTFGVTVQVVGAKDAQAGATGG
jgi:hypothetical protein